MSSKEIVRYIDLKEAEQTFIAACDLPKAAAEALAISQRFEVARDVSRDGYWISSRGWVGQFPLTAGLVLRVAPKVPVGNLFWMLDVAYRLRSFEMLKGQVEGVQTFPELFERLASIFVSLVDQRIRKGLAREYRDYVEPMSAVRGRISMRDNFRGRFDANLVCEYQEQTADIDDNRILCWALFLIGRLHVRDQALAGRVRRAFLSMSGGVNVQPMSVADCLARRYTRLTCDYSPLHTLSRFFIEHSGPAIQHGDTAVLPFAVNMPQLFEAYIAEVLAIESKDRYVVDRQFRIDVTSTFDLKFRIDLVLRPIDKSVVLAVIDTKYKPLPPAQADIFQIVTYAVHAETNSAVLVYPTALAQRFVAQVGKVRVSVVGIDVGRIPRPDAHGLFNELLRASQLHDYDGKVVMQ